MEVCEVVDMLEKLCSDTSVPKNVRNSLKEIKVSFNCPSEEIPIRIDAALEKVESLSMDPNLSTFSRSELWNLTSVLEELNRR